MKKTLTVAAILCGLAIIAIFGVKGYYENQIEKMKGNYENQIAKLEEDYNVMETKCRNYEYLYNSSNIEIAKYKQKADKSETELKQLKSQIYLSKKSTESLSRGNYRYNDLSNYEIMTVQEMNDWIAARAPKDSPFLGEGEFFLKIGQQYNMDPKYIIAHAGVESGWGKYTLGKNNYFGIGAYNASPVSSALTFSNGFEAGIAEGVEWIYKNYYSKGYTTLNKMIYGGKSYAQYDDGTPNDKWIEQIESVIYP